MARDFMWVPHTVQTRAASTAIAEQLGNQAVLASLRGAAVNLPALVRNTGLRTPQLAHRLIGSVVRSLGRPHVMRRKRQINRKHSEGKNTLPKPTLTQTSESDAPLPSTGAKDKRTTGKHTGSLLAALAIRRPPRVEETADRSSTSYLSLASIPDVSVASVASSGVQDASSSSILPKNSADTDDTNGRRAQSTETGSVTQNNSDRSTEHNTARETSKDNGDKTLYSRRRNAGLFVLRRSKRGILSKILSGVRTAGTRIPGYAYPLAGSVAEWGIAASNNLQVKSPSQHTFFPTVNLVKLERYTYVTFF